MTFDEVSMERSKSFVFALQVNVTLCFIQIFLFLFVRQLLLQYCYHFPFLVSAELNWGCLLSFITITIKDDFSVTFSTVTVLFNFKFKLSTHRCLQIMRICLQLHNCEFIYFFQIKFYCTVSGQDTKDLNGMEPLRPGKIICHSL